jgi:hypothetical protein
VKKLVFVAALVVSCPAFAADFESVAFERLAYELSAASSPAARVDSVSAYVDALDRLGVTPKSARGCLIGALSGAASDLCKSAKIEARSGGAGTGGAD